MKGRLDGAQVRIDAPNAQSAFRLERRLRHLHAVAVGRGPRWEVDLERYDGAPEELTAVVEGWLGEAGLADTTVWLEGSPLRVRRR